MIPMATKLDLPILRLPDWPAQDRAAWEAAATSVGWFDDGGRLARYSRNRIRVFESAYGRWLSFLVSYDPDFTLENGLDHLGRDRVGAYYERLHAVLAPCTVRAYMTDLLTVVRAMAPDQSFEALHNAVRHIWRIAEPVTDKYGRLVPARDLYTLGCELMQDAPARSTLLKQAGLYRDGLMIAMLIARPVRLGNFASIEIDLHIKKLNHDYWLVFPPPKSRTAGRWNIVCRLRCANQSNAIWISIAPTSRTAAGAFGTVMRATHCGFPSMARR